MAALLVVGAVMTGCSSEDDLANNPQQPVKQDNIVTVTTTIGLGGGDDAGGSNRALDIDYTNKKLTKTFAVGDQVLLQYESTTEGFLSAVSNALTAGDISADGKTATLTFTLKDASGTTDITSTITSMTVQRGTDDTYNITRSATAGPIYVIMTAFDEAPLTVTATDGTKTYTKMLDSRNYEVGHFYQQGLRMTEVP